MFPCQKQAHSSGCVCGCVFFNRVKSRSTLCSVGLTGTSKHTSHKYKPQCCLTLGKKTYLAFSLSQNISSGLNCCVLSSTQDIGENDVFVYVFDVH